jgi:hypothetical protein
MIDDMKITNPTKILNSIPQWPFSNNRQQMAIRKLIWMGGNPEKFPSEINQKLIWERRQKHLIIFLTIWFRTMGRNALKWSCLSIFGKKRMFDRKTDYALNMYSFLF